MATLVKYVVETGVIVGVWESNNEALLAGQAAQDEAGMGYLPGLPDVPVSAFEEGYVVVDGVIVPKPVVREEL